MNKGSDQLPTNSDPAPTQATRFEGRRQLIKAALVAAPLILTLRGRPAHAQLTSLGSVQIPYGPNLYITQTDIDNSGGSLVNSDLHKPISPNTSGGSKSFKVVSDDRRNQNAIKTFSRP